MDQDLIKKYNPLDVKKNIKSLKNEESTTFTTDAERKSDQVYQACLNDKGVEIHANLDGDLKENYNEESDEENEEVHNMNVGLGMFVDSFKNNMIQHIKDDKRMQNINRLGNDNYDPEQEHERKEALLKSLTKEQTSSMGLPQSFVSKKDKTINLKKPKNLVRLQNYYGDLENEPCLESKGPNPALLNDLGKNEFFCQLCEARCNGLQSFEAHMKGSKHFKKMKKVQEVNLIQSAQIAGNVAFPTFGSHGNAPSHPSIPISKNEPDLSKASITSLLRSIDKPLIGLQYLVEYVYDGNLNEPRYICEMCEKRCDNHTLEAHVTSYAHRWSYIKLRYTDYADEIREYGPKKQDRTEAIEDYAARIESEENYPRKIDKSVVVNANKVVSVEEALDNSSISNLHSLLRQTRNESNISRQPLYRDQGSASTYYRSSYPARGMDDSYHDPRPPSPLSKTFPRPSTQLSIINDYLNNTKKSSKIHERKLRRETYQDPTCPESHYLEAESRYYRGNPDRKHRDRTRHPRSPLSRRKSGCDGERRRRSRSSSTPPSLIRKRLEQFNAHDYNQQYEKESDRDYIVEHRQKKENLAYEQPPKTLTNKAEMSHDNIESQESNNNLSSDDIQLFKLWKETFMSQLNSVRSCPPQVSTGNYVVQETIQYPQAVMSNPPPFNDGCQTFQTIVNPPFLNNNMALNEFITPPIQLTNEQYYNQHGYFSSQNVNPNILYNNQNFATPQPSIHHSPVTLIRPNVSRMRMPTSVPRFGSIRSANSAVNDKVDAYINNIMRRNRI